eukprot:gene8026-biopygen16600
MIGKIELFGRTPCICRGGGLRWPDAGGPPVSSPLPPLPEPLRPVGGGVGPPRVSGITGVRFRRRRPAAHLSVLISNAKISKFLATYSIHPVRSHVWVSSADARSAAGACTFAGRVICRDPEGARACS